MHEPQLATDPSTPADPGGGASLDSETGLLKVWDGHGAAILALARLLFDDDLDAEDVVVRAVLDACHPGSGTAGPGRHELARYVYVLWLRQGAHTERAGLSSSQRSALALGLFGDHTCDEVAALMALPTTEVADLMRSALRAV